MFLVIDEKSVHYALTLFFYLNLNIKTVLKEFIICNHRKLLPTFETKIK